jgi:hypothetical protein
MKNSIIVLLVLALTLSCKDKNDDVSATKTVSEYLTGTANSKKWKVTDGTIKQGETSINLIANQPPCITDNILILNANKTYELIEGPTKCDPSKDPDLVLKANWTLVEDPKSITIDKLIFLNYVLDKPKFIISEINDDVFKGQADIVLNGRNLIANVTFTAVK